MNTHLQNLQPLINASAALTDEEKQLLPKAINAADKQWAIADFKLDRTEKVKRTTALLLEETIAELEQKRQVVEESNAALEKSLKQLKATQTQLIQSETMASLGELTAGIAHEIQPPLSFVNNWSEINDELISELFEELTHGNKEEAISTADTLKNNAQKINEHGKRGGSIVKGTQEHSRKNDGQKEPTDINQLADECLRLAYHGMRAKDKSFQADYATDFDETLPMIPLLSQDISRVLVNLINNAFYAVLEKTQTAGADYKPLVQVATKRKDAKVIITVSDNGNGIPDEIKDKIFQPFFTTKPTGSGTGLGLSLSYDIVKAHGGEISVDFSHNMATIFSISLPKNTK